MTDKLADLELCKKIAEIEGLNTWIDQNGDLRANHFNTQYDSGYSPLTNKALLFDLSIKHKINIEWFGGLPAYASMSDYDCDFEPVASVCGGVSGIPRAILECIVEANK